MNLSPLFLYSLIVKLILLAVIYLAFISLGLPDSVTGSAWPVIHTELGCPVSSAGIISMIVAGGTIVSAVYSQHFIKRYGTARVTAVSILMTASALLGYSLSPSLFWILLCAIPLGLGGGCVDAALNHYVTIHYSAGQMGYLHCFWGVGTLVSPFLLSYLFSHGGSWRLAYRINVGIQLFIMSAVIMATPLFNRTEHLDGTDNENDAENSDGNRVYRLSEIIKVKGAVHALLAFTTYCGLENTAFLWVASFAVYARGFSPSMAALVTSMIFLGLTVGRFLTGMFSDHTSDRTLLRICHTLSLVSFLLLLAVRGEAATLVTVFFLGIGFGPIYPTMLHQTVNYYDRRYGQAIIAFQMAFAYIGSTFMPPLFGLISKKLSLGFFPFFTFILFILHVVEVSLKNSCAKERASISNRERR